nr:hypothetical protein [Kibdelosporangium sp. MJ126-NF4]
MTPTVVGAVAVQAITWWLQHDRPCSAGEIADRTGGMTRALIDVELRHPS